MLYEHVSSSNNVSIPPGAFITINLRCSLVKCMWNATIQGTQVHLRMHSHPTVSVSHGLGQCCISITKASCGLVHPQAAQSQLPIQLYSPQADLYDGGCIKSLSIFFKPGQVSVICWRRLFLCRERSCCLRFFSNIARLFFSSLALPHWKMGTAAV